MSNTVGTIAGASQAGTAIVRKGTLLIIDMQPDGFPLARVVIQPVLREVARAMRLGWSIRVVEYDLECAGKTDDRIIATLTGSRYEGWLPVRKQSEDGSSEVIQSLTAGDSAELFRVVGVTTDDCIAKTVRGLLGKLPHCIVEVVMDACRNWQADSFDWSTFPSSPRVRLFAR